MVPLVPGQTHADILSVCISFQLSLRVHQGSSAMKLWSTPTAKVMFSSLLVCFRLLAALQESYERIFINFQDQSELMRNWENAWSVQVTIWIQELFLALQIMHGGGLLSRSASCYWSNSNVAIFCHGFFNVYLHIPSSGWGGYTCLNHPVPHIEAETKRSPISDDSLIFLNDNYSNCYIWVEVHSN